MIARVIVAATLAAPRKANVLRALAPPAHTALPPTGREPA